MSVSSETPGGAGRAGRGGMAGRGRDEGWSPAVTRPPGPLSAPLCPAAASLCRCPGELFPIDMIQCSLMSYMMPSSVNILVINDLQHRPCLLSARGAEKGRRHIYYGSEKNGRSGKPQRRLDVAVNFGSC